MLMMLEERGWKGVLWSFIQFLHISGYPGWIGAISAFWSWNSMVDDGITVLWAREESPKKTPQETSTLSCPRTNVQPTNLQGECLHPPVTLCPPQDPPTRILNISQWRKSSVAIGIITFARLHRGRILLFLSRSLQHQGISARGDARWWVPMPRTLIIIGEEILSVCFSKQALHTDISVQWHVQICLQKIVKEVFSLL